MVKMHFLHSLGQVCGQENGTGDSWSEKELGDNLPRQTPANYITTWANI